LFVLLVVIVVALVAMARSSKRVRGESSSEFTELEKRG
jgi:hypothetical protein